ncbi:MAG TPA: alpha/beta family hydrolase [Gemmatimonadales bacterium]|nr:alpha/beta family hydrolase [Gemmatimonadales bacterium]
MPGSTEARPLEIRVADGKVSGLLVAPPGARALYVIAHGAGAGMRHPFLENIAAVLAARGVASLRYQFAYMEAGSRRPDAPAVATAAVRAAVAAARDAAPGLPVIAGGKSFGGRMTSTAEAEEPMEGVKGLAFLGFPLHPPGRPGDSRAAHLDRVAVPMLFLSGTRDEFATLDLLRPVVSRLGARATLHLIEGGDHSFHVLKKTGRTDAEVMEEAGDVIARWSASLSDR